MYYIYCYTNIKNGMQYVGQTNNLRRRDTDHKCKNSNTYFDRAYRKHPEDFVLEIIDGFPDWITQEFLDDKEDEYITFVNSLFPNGYNFKTGGRQGYKITEECRKRISKSCKESYTETHRQKQSERMIELWKDPDRLIKHSKRMSGENNPMYGKIRNEITGIHSPVKRSCICVEENKIFVTLAEAVEWLKNNGKEKANSSRVCEVCKGNRKTAYGYHWKYVEVVE